MGKNSANPEGPDNETEPMLSNHYQYTDRPTNDKTWAFAYAAFLALSVVGGVYATTHRNHQFGVLFDQHKMSNPHTCPAPSAGRRLLAEQDSVGFPDFFRSFAFALVGTALASLASGVVFLYTFRHKPLLMVKLTIASQIALPAAVGLYLLASGATLPGVMMLVMAGVAAFAFYLWRDFIPLCARLLSVAAQGLNENQGLIVFAVVSNIVLALLMVPLLGISGVASTNGQLVPNPARVVQGQQCMDAQGKGVPCCTWELDSWMGPFMAFNSVTLLWTLFLVGQVRVFVTAGTIAQWYFAPQGASNKGTTKRSLGHAMGPSFGSLCFGSAILTLVQLIRNLMESVRQQYAQGNGDGDAGQIIAGILLSIMSCILEGFLQLVEFLTKFATVRLAITGEHFMLAARSSTDLLARNFLKTYGVWFFPPMVLQLGAFLIAAVWGVLVFSLSWLGWHRHESGTGEAIALGLLAGFIAWAVNSFFAGVLLSVVDSVYFCYALDRDNQEVTKPEVHEVYSEVPVSKGIAVEQPGGNLAYGAPYQAPEQQGQYVPPSDTRAASNTPRESNRV